MKATVVDFNNFDGLTVKLNGKLYSVLNAWFEKNGTELDVEIVNDSQRRVNVIRAPKRTHRTLLVLNYAVTLKEEDSFFYCEWPQLKKYLSRAELIQLIRNVRNGQHWIATDGNGYVATVQGV